MRIRLALLPTTLALALASAPARAASFYVATSGNDGYPGSETLPFQTVGKGVAALRAGDTLYIRGGTYAGQSINPKVAGTSAAWVTISAYPGELPILDGTGVTNVGSGFEPTDVAVQYVRVSGLVARNWKSSGFSNGFNFPSVHIEVRSCVAEGNGINGITFYKAAGVLIQGNIVAHNGNQLPSFSSGVNIFMASGSYQDNIVRGNVSFENVDISSNHSDGSGFILDMGSTGALFDGNIAFGNGGSCIRLTSSMGAHIINNTCFHNGVDPANAFAVHEIFFSETTSRTNVLVSNNLAAAIAGRMGVNQTSGTGSTFHNNLFVDNNGATPFFTSTAGLDFRPTAGSTTVIDQGASGDAGANDIGFDPRCLKPQGGQAVARWQYAPDYAYIASVGGVAGCFHPGPRRNGSAPDLGAYELGNPITGTTGAGGASGGTGGASGGGGAGGGGATTGAGGGAGAGGSSTTGGGGTSGAGGGATTGAGGAGPGGSTGGSPPGQDGAGGCHCGAGGGPGGGALALIFAQSLALALALRARRRVRSAARGGSSG